MGVDGRRDDAFRVARGGGLLKRLARLAGRALGLALVVSVGCHRSESTPSDGRAPVPAGSVASRVPADSRDATPPDSGWKTGRVELPPSGPGSVRVTEISRGAHPGFDRVTWRFEAGRPGVRVEWLDAPPRACGSGRPVRLPGAAGLEVRLSPAAAHDETGAPSVPDPPDAPPGSALRDLVRTCDFEGVVTWVVGADSKAPFRVAVADDPPRIAVDVRRAEP